MKECPEAHMYAPAMFVKKWEILKYLVDNDLYDYCTWCEDPKKGGNPCGKCHSCQSHNNHLAVAEMHDYEDC